jgi:hypothetical protein
MDKLWSLMAKGITLEPKFMQVLEMCVENGIKLGLARAHKHNENPNVDQIQSEILQAVMSEIYEWFDVPE